MRRRTKLSISVGVVVVLILGYLFLFGKLFPYSPIAIGFARHEMAHTVIYVQHGSDFNKYQIIDNLLGPVEAFHQLKFKSKPKIYIFSDRLSYLRRTVTQARFYAYPNGNLVVSPWAIAEADSGKISLEIYLTHELSHSLIYQQMGVLAAYKCPQWLMEGIAVYSSNQMGTTWYPSKEETYMAICDGNYFPPEYYKTSREDEVKLNVKYRIAFIYSEFGCIVDYLVESYGKDKLIDLIKSLSNNENYKVAFMKIYGIDFDGFLLDFQAHARQEVKPATIQ